MNRFMELAYNEAGRTMTAGIGGPFGAAVVKDGEVIAVAGNRVLADHDPTAHAEVTAIREACKKLGTHSLDGCEIYATGEPCPMCLSAIIWAGIKTCYFANPVNEAEKIGFADEAIYEHIRGEKKILDIIKLDDCTECLSLYRDYTENERTMY